MTDLLCEEGIRRAAVALRRAFHDGADRDARADMALASLWSGMALANAGLGAVHGLAGAIGGRFQAPHGAICAALLPHVSAVNLQALETRAVDHPARARYAAVAHWLTGTPAAAGGDGVAWLRDLVAELQIPRLSAYGVAGGHVDELVAQALRASSTKGNPLELSREELSAALAEAV
jgi:alcohol dehydrogenase class IV